MGKYQLALAFAVGLLAAHSGLGPALADHILGHDEVAEGGILALEQRLFDEENKPDADTLGNLSCSNDQIAKFNGASWVCAADDDTSAAGCPSGEVLSGGSCVPLPAGSGDTLVRTLVVSPSGDGSIATLNGQELLDALTFLGTVIPAPGVTNPWLIKVEPGIYDVGATPVQMLPYVDIEGSGQGVTEIIGTVNSLFAGVVVAANNSELRHLTVGNESGLPIAIYCESKTDFRVSSARAESTLADASSIHIPFLALDCILTLTDVVVIAGQNSGNSHALNILGLPDTPSNATLVNVTGISTSTGDESSGLWVTGGTVTARNSVFVGNTRGLRTFAGVTANIVSTQLDGALTVEGEGTQNCVGAYDGAFAALNASCL